MGAPSDPEVFRAHWRRAVAEYTDRPAVRDDERVLSYREFDRLQGAIGAAVAARVPIGAVVGIVVPKRVWSLAAMLGVINAARAALLLDPDDPPERWHQHCTRADAALVLAESRSQRDAVREAGLTPLGADDVDDTAPPRDDPIDPAAASWIICTSGSTGVPKLVATPQRMMAEAWVRNIERNRFHGDLGAAVLVLPPLWSAAIRMGTMQALCGGACAVLVDTASTPASRLLALIEEYDVRRVHLGPWLLRTLLDAAETGGRPVTRLSLVVSTGAALTVDDVARTWHWFPNARVRSHYGSTEVSGIANVDLPPGADLDDPLLMAMTIDAETRVRVLADGEEVAAGASGELWVWSSRAGGRYLDAPDLEQQSAMVDADGEQWFRTGDLGRLLPDGRLVVEGRNDARVKVNGLAVDLTAVAAAVRSLDGVGDAEVTAVPRGDDTQLVAWIVAARGAFLSVRDLRAGLGPRLPRFMFPHVFRAVSSIPRLPNGKVDRMALRAAAAAEIPTGADAAPPATSNERAVAAQFELVLDRRDVGVHESFFELGGDSLAALQVVEAIVDRFVLPDERRPALESALMTEGTVAALVRVLEATDPEGDGVEQATLRPDGVGLLVLGRGEADDDVPIVLLPGGGQDPLAFRPLVRRLPGRRVWTLTPRGFRSRRPADRSVEQIAGRFADALLALDAGRAFVIAGFSFGGFVAHTLAIELTARGADVLLLAILDARTPDLPPPVPKPTTAELVRQRWRRIPHAAWWRTRRWYLGATAGIVRRRGWPQGEAFMTRAGRLSHRFTPGVFAGPALVVRSAYEAAALPPDLGWGRYVTGEVTTITLPGNHFGILLEPSVAEIGERLAAAAVPWES